MSLRPFLQTLPKLLAAFALCIATVRGQEAHVASITERVLNTRREILAHGGDKGEALDPESCLFVSFWDFDGTILDGDCSEGHVVDGKVVYTGLFEECIRRGHGDVYPASGDGFDRAMADYRRMDETIGSWLAYPFMVQVLKGAKESEIVALAGDHFEAHQKPCVFASSLAMMRTLEQNGVRVHVISASADAYLRGIAPKLGIPVSRVRGLRTMIKDGRLTERIDYPVTYACGKTEVLQEEAENLRRKNPGKRVFVLAGFGNSYGTDGPFLKHIATQKLPAGAPVAVMINGGKPKPGYEGVFTCVEQKTVIGR